MILHRARPAAESAGTSRHKANDKEDMTVKNTAEFEAYKDFICKMLDRCDLRRIKIIYEFVLAMTDEASETAKTACDIWRCLRKMSMEQLRRVLWYVNCIWK